MTRDAIVTLIARHQAALHGRAPKAIAADYTPGGAFLGPAHTVEGREAIEAVYAFWFTAFPDLTITFGTPVIDGNRASVFWTFVGTAQGPFYGLVGAGKRVDLTGATEYLVEDAGIAAAHHVFDFSSILMKTGVLKVKPGV